MKINKIIPHLEDISRIGLKQIKNLKSQIVLRKEDILKQALDIMEYHIEQIRELLK